jgi:hypothetical protein
MATWTGLGDNTELFWAVLSHSSSKRPSSRPRARRPASDSRVTRRAMEARRDPNLRYMRVGRRSAPPTRDAHRPGKGSSTLAGRHATAMPATSSTLGGQAKRRRGRPQATTLDGAGATTAMKTARRRRNPRGPACSAGGSARRPSPSTSASPRPSSSTTGKRTPACGSMTTAWRASWAGPPATRSSSATSPYTSPTQRGHGSSTCLPARSTTGMIWSARSLATSRARMCALGTLGTFAPAPRGPASRSGTSYGASPSVARSSRAWHNPRSCTPSSRAPRAGTSCAS